MSNDPTAFNTFQDLFEIGKKYRLPLLRDFDGNPHGLTKATDIEQIANTATYEYQGETDVNNDGIVEAIFTNRLSGRWATVGRDPITGMIDFNKHGRAEFDDHSYKTFSRVVGIYIDPLVAEGEANGGFLLNGEEAPKRRGPFDSQRRFQNDLNIDNLSLRISGDFDGDGFGELYWKVEDGTAYLRTLMHADGNIQYANYQSEAQMRDYLTSTGHAELIAAVL